MTHHDVMKVYPDGKLIWNGQTYPCAIGKGGIVQDKKEGDGATPVGRFPLKQVYYRPDRLKQPETILQTQAISSTDGWCDDPEHVAYNKPIKLPFKASHEELWRDDHIYDVIVVLGHNDNPPIPGKGSAIFFHIARNGFTGTEGCVAVALTDMLHILKSIQGPIDMEIMPSS